MNPFIDFADVLATIAESPSRYASAEAVSVSVADSWYRAFASRGQSIGQTWHSDQTEAPKQPAGSDTRHIWTGDLLDSLTSELSHDVQGSAVVYGTRLKYAPQVDQWGEYALIDGTAVEVIVEQIADMVTVDLSRAEGSTWSL